VSHRDTGNKILLWSTGVLEALSELEPYETMAVLEFAVARHFQGTLPKQGWSTTADLFAEHLKQALEQQLPPAPTKKFKGGNE
jgi:hypothetical protein